MHNTILVNMIIYSKVIFPIKSNQLNIPDNLRYIINNYDFDYTLHCFLNIMYTCGFNNMIL